MSYRETIKEMGINNGGYVILKDATKAGIPSAIVSRMAKEGELEKISSGIYLLPDHFEDELYEISKRYTHAVYCRNTALYLHGLANRSLESIEANFPNYFNTRNIQKVTCYYPRERLYKLGICEVETPFGNKVKAYDVERCLCDLFYYRDGFESEERAYAFKNADWQKINYFKLFDYAKELKVEMEIKTTLEMIL